MANRLDMLDERQRCVIILSLVRKVVQSLSFEIFCPPNGPRQTLYKLHIISCLRSMDNAILSSFHARKRITESQFEAHISHNKHDNAVL